MADALQPQAPPRRTRRRFFWPGGLSARLLILTILFVVSAGALALPPALVNPDHPLARLFAQVREKGLLAGACKACSVKLGVAAEVEAAGVPLIGDMSGHPSMGSYMEAGWQVVTF